MKAFLAKAKTVLDKVLDFIDLFLAKLKKGAKHLFDEFSKIVDEIFASGKKVEELPRTKAEKRVLERKEAQAKRLEEKKNRRKRAQRGGGDINKSFAENAGIKTEKWISEAKVYGQSENNTCAATSLKMVMDDKGFVLSEDYLAGLLDTQKNDGASILDIPKLFDDNLYYYEMTTIAEEDIKFTKLLEKLEEGDKAIVSVYKDGFGSAHAKTLEKVESGKVFLRDPLPINQGSSYSMKIEDFENIFNKKAVIIKK